MCIIPEGKLCDYGCGQEAKYKFGNGKLCCSKDVHSCPIKRKENGERHKKVRPVIDKPKFCEYGCGKEATHQLKNGKWICSNFMNSCPAIINKTKPKLKNKIYFTETQQCEDKFCDYGCGQLAKYKFKNGKYCCSKNSMTCPEERIKNGLRQKGCKNKKHDKPIFIINEENLLCDYGCGQLAKYKFKNGKYCCNIHSSKCDYERIRTSKALKGKTLGRHPSKETRDKQSKKALGRKFSDETIKIWIIQRTGKLPTEETKKKRKETYIKNKSGEKQRQRMLNGLVEICHKAIKNPSTQEVALRNIVKEIYPDCEFPYKILNYFVDIALIEYKIAIEYDGYYHFNSQEAIDYHNMRQKRIESEGWNFYRVTMYDKFPTIDQVKNDLLKLIDKENENE